MGDRLCCFIPDQLNPENSRCSNLAEFEIWFGENPTFEDYTDTCGTHISHLLDENTHFTIVRINN